MGQFTKVDLDQGKTNNSESREDREKKRLDGMDIEEHFGKLRARPQSSIYRDSRPRGCQALLEHDQEGTTTLDFGNLHKGTVLCLRTNQKRIAFLTVITEAQDPARSDLILDVRVTKPLY
jgi:hypothetical protein